MANVVLINVKRVVVIGRQAC